MDTLDVLKQAKDALDKATASKKQTQDVLNNLGPAVVDALKPSLDANSEVMRSGLADLAKAVSGLKFDVPNIPEIKVPEIKIPEIHVPAPQVTVNVADIPAPIIPEIKIPKIVVPKPEVTVNVPPIKIPPLEWPSEKMPIEGWVQLMGVDLQHPLPVQVMNAKEIGGSAVISSGGGGGGIVTIGGALATVGVNIINPDGLPTSISATITGGGSTVSLVNSDGTYYNSDNPLPVTFSAASIQPVSQVSGHIWSVFAQDALTTTSSTTLVNGDNRIRVELPATTVAATQSGSWDVDNSGTFAIQVQDGQASTISSHIFNTDFRGLDVYIGGSLNTTVSELASADNRLKVDGSAVTQPISVTDIFATTAASNVVTPDNRVKVDGSGVTQPVSGTVAVSGVSGSVAANLYNADGQYTASNPFPVTIASGALTSTIAVGTTLHDAADDGDAPLKIGGVAAQTVPTPVADGDRVRFIADDIGRQLFRVTARDLVQTAYAQLTNGTETTLLAGVASTFLDLVYVMGANNSDAAVQVDLRSGTANGVVMTIEIPAYGTSGVAPSQPIPQDVTANTWTADMPDITGTTISLTALFNKEK